MRVKDLGFERRPALAESAQRFMENGLPETVEAVESEDPEIFDRVLESFTHMFNTCNAAGDVPQIHVNEPAVRQTLSGGNKKSHACYRHGFSPNMINRYEILTFLPAFSFSLGIEIVNTPFS
jgi:hypothetical protein